MKTLVIESQEQWDALEVVKNKITIDQNFEVKCEIVVKTNLVVDGNAYFNATADFNGNASFNWYADFMGSAYFNGNYLVIRGDMFWAAASMPALPVKNYIERILPPAYQKDHWQDRLSWRFMLRSNFPKSFKEN